MDPKRFKNNSSGRVVKVGLAQSPYYAFLPNPLPPEIRLDVELWNVLSEADRALGELAGLGHTVPNPDLLIQPFIRREAVLSSRIEGTQTGLQELYAYEVKQLPIFGDESSRQSLDAHEVSNYVRALQYGLSRLKTLPISLRLIRELHEHLMKGVRANYATPGEFRRTQNWVGQPGSTLSDATFVPPPPAEMQQALSAFENYLHASEQLPPLIRLACIHYQFEAIHPFIDGNGRVGRLLISLLLIHWQLLPLPLLYLSAYFERHRNDYYDLLLAVSERGTWSDWLRFFLRGVTEQAQDAIQRAKQLQDLRANWHQRVLTPRASGIMLKLIDRLFETPILSTADVRTHFKVTHPTAMNSIKRLVDLNILKEITGKDRNRMYIAEKIMAIIE